MSWYLNKLILMKKYKIWLAFFAMFLVGTSWVTIDNVIIRPFPFIDVSYIISIEEFNAPPIQLDIDINLPLSNKTIKKAISYTEPYNDYPVNDFFGDIQKATAATEKLMSFSQGSDFRTISDVLTLNTRFLSGCSESAKIFSAIMQSLGYQTRVIWMKGHTVPEIFVAKYGWVLVDVYGNVIFQNKFNKFMSLLSVVENYEEARPQPIVKRKENIYRSWGEDFLSNGYFLTSDNAYKGQTLFLIVEGKNLFSFHKNTRIFTKIISSMVSYKSISKAMQYVGKNSEMVGNFGLNFYRRFDEPEG